MAHIVSDGLSAVQATGQRVLGGAAAVAGGIRGEVGAVAHNVRGEIDGIRHHGTSASRRRGWGLGRSRDTGHGRSAWRSGAVEVFASAAGALAAFVVSRLVRARLRASGK